MEMQTRHSYNGFAYWGECEGWGIVVGQHRDSDPLTRSNFNVIRKDLETRFPDDVVVESASSDMVGWVESVVVRPGSAAWDAAIEWLERLEQYPVADEENYSQTEWDDSVETIRECLVRTPDFHWFSDMADEWDNIATAIVYAWTEDGTRELPGLTYTHFPSLDIQEDRDLIATGIRNWRRLRRERVTA